jgi:hypothetical protein
MQLKRFVPKSIKRPIKQAVRRRQLTQAIRKIANLGERQMPSRDLLSELIVGWDNDGYVANLDYLEEVARSSIETTGHILECGSGVTTVLLGILCSRRPIQVWSLEHSLDWQKRVAQVLGTNGLSGARVCFSPLIDHGKFVWYDPHSLQLPDQFSLVICDGPPGTTKGGRYGLLPVMLDRLAPETRILLDDAGRPGERALINEWVSEYDFTASTIDQENHSFAVLHRAYSVKL